MTNDRADKSGPGELAVAAQERERVLAENAQEMPKLGKRTGADVIEIGRRLTEMKKLCGHGNWLLWLQREFGWTNRNALNWSVRASLKFENFSDLS